MKLHFKQSCVHLSSLYDTFVIPFFTNLNLGTAVVDYVQILPKEVMLGTSLWLLVG